MALQYPDLDRTTCQYMLEELELDVKEARLYVSPRLSGKGVTDYPALLKSAIESGDDTSLAGELRKDGRLHATEQRRKPKGGTQQQPFRLPPPILWQKASSSASTRADCVGGHKSRATANSKYTAPKR